MNQIRTVLLCLAALAIATAFGSHSACRGEDIGAVTVVGSTWQERHMCESAQEETVMPPVPEVPEAPMQPEAVAEDGESYLFHFVPIEQWFKERPVWRWMFDYRYRGTAGSGITSTYGTRQPPPTGYAPASQLNFPINTSWHGLQVGIDEPTWGVRFEWMAAQPDIQGQFSDYDWRSPGSSENFTDLGYSDERFTDGQTIDFGMDFLWTKCLFNMPIELWPTAGFRWQRFNIDCYDGYQVKYDNHWLNPPDAFPGDVISFSQQFYMGYLGGQFRTKIKSVRLTFEADWGATWGYNVDHHLLRAGDRYTMEATQGNSWHVAFTAEIPLTEFVRAGFQVDHMEICTTGTHRLKNLPLGEDVTWDNGVSVTSNQTSIMAFLRVRL